MKKIEFTEEERLKGLNHIDLGEDGDFYGEYVVVTKTGFLLFGWWDIVDDIEEQGLKPEDGPFWASIGFMPEEDPEDEYGSDVEASDYVQTRWEYWEISTTDDEF